MKKIVILKHGGGELANQLWNYVSVYAFGLEINTVIQNSSFFEYHSFFNFLPKESLLTKIIASQFRGPIRRRNSLKNRFWRFIYALYSKAIMGIFKARVISSENSKNRTTHLPPTKTIELPNSNTMYFTGWFFRNPEGLKKYREKLVRAFIPKENIIQGIDTFLLPIKSKFKHVIGVHLRQGDYISWKNGIYFIEQKRMREILEDFLFWSKLKKDEVCFVVASDEKINKTILEGLNFVISQTDAVSDLFMLSKTDLIIGSDSSFGHFASWYGNIPHIIMKKEKIDWEYYQDKNLYFQNKYCTMVHF